MRLLKIFATAFCFAVSLSFIADVSAATIYVDDDAAPGGDGSAAAPFATLQDAAAAANSKDKISIADGKYSGDVDYGSNIITNEVVSGDVAVIKDNLTTASTLYRTGAGRLVLNGTNTIKSLQVVNGTTVIASPTESVTNKLSLQGLYIYANKTLVISNMTTTLNMGSASFASQNSSIFKIFGGTFTASCDSFRPVNEGSSSSTSAKMVFDGTRAAFNLGSTGGFRIGNGSKSQCEVIVTNNATISTPALWGVWGSIKQYSGSVSVTRGGTCDFSLGYNTNAGEFNSLASHRCETAQV